MSETVTYNGKTAFFNTQLPSLSVSTFHDKYYRIDTTMAKAEPISQDEAEEQEWDRIIYNPRIRRGLRRFVAEARQQIAVGEIEEGGFSVE